MDSMNRLLMDTAARLFADGAESETQDAAERGEFPDRLWQQLEDNGLLSALLPEEAGGVGMAPPSVLPMMRVAGAQALAVPLAETLYARRLLAEQGAVVPPGPISVVCAPTTRLRVGSLTDGRARVEGRSRWPWPARSHLLVVAEHALALLEPGTGDAVEIGRVPLAGEPNSVVSVDEDTDAFAVDRAALELALGFLATAHCQKMAGAMERVLDLAIEHVQGREQFGRSLAQFQAVQHLVAQLAAETAVVGAAADSVSARFAASSNGDPEDAIAVAAAKARASEAAAKVARIAHQLHGAIGFTREHDLHRFTRRLLRFRDEFGDEGFWQARIGALAIAAGSDGLWPLLCTE